MDDTIDKDKARQTAEANTCVALGAGVGVMGAAGAAISGAVCPLCVIVAPALVGYGLYARIKNGRELEHSTAARTAEKE